MVLYGAAGGYQKLFIITSLIRHARMAHWTAIDSMKARLANRTLNYEFRACSLPDQEISDGQPVKRSRLAGGL
jgi:hypothetical protein